MNQDTFTTFNCTEEAFLLRSLKEVVNVWARGHGQASLNLTVTDGVAALNLGFQLGRPSDPHLQGHHHHEHAQPLHQHRKQRRRGQARRDREAPVRDHNAAKASAAVILPFSGRLLPVVPTDPPPPPAPITPTNVVTAPVSTPSPAAPGSLAAPRGHQSFIQFKYFPGHFSPKYLKFAQN